MRSMNLVESILQSALDSQLADGCPGIILLIDAPKLGITFSRACGVFARGNSQFIRFQDAFRAASITKAVTAAATVSLAAKGYWNLDDSVMPFLSPSLRQRLCVLEGSSNGDALTLRRLLNHTSGLPDYFFDPHFQAQVQVNPNHLWQPEELIEAALMTGKLSFEPGTNFSYGDTGYVLIGLAIEGLLDCSLAEAYRSYILQPLEMASTYLEWREPARGAGLSHHYDGDQDLRETNLSYDWAGGGLVTTAHDLSQFLRGLFQGVLFDQRWVMEMIRWQSETRWRPHSSARYLRYGLGLGTTMAYGEEVWGVTGVWGAFAYYWSTFGVTITGTLNRVGGDRAALLDAVIQSLKSFKVCSKNG